MATNEQLKVFRTAGTLFLVAPLLLSPLVFGCSKHKPAAVQAEATLEELNVALDTWMMVKGTIPQSVNDLTNFPALKTKQLPIPPAGKKLTINPASRRVVFDNE